MAKIEITVNGAKHTREVEDRTLLANFIRDVLGLTGTHIGCDTSQCGCCTVHVNGCAIKSCTMLAVQADGHSIETVEGLSGRSELHPLQEGFKEEHGLQCGFCTPGMLMSMSDLMSNHNADPSPSEIRGWLDGNLCRCTGYQHCVRAVQHACIIERPST